MTKRDYEKAATIAQGFVTAHNIRDMVTGAFCSLFRDDNAQFNEARFRTACVPGANVKARPRTVAA